jgi:mRNA interferase MazF
VRRGALWWANLPPPWGRRPVVLLSRDRAYGALYVVAAAPLTSTVRGIRSEVLLEPAVDSVPQRSVITLDNILSLELEWLDTPITQLRPEKLAELDLALHFTLGITHCPTD